MTKASIGTKTRFRNTCSYTITAEEEPLSERYYYHLFSSSGYLTAKKLRTLRLPRKIVKASCFRKAPLLYRVNACLRAAKIIEIRNWSAHYLFAPAAKGYDLLLGIKTWCKKVGHKTFTHMLLLMKGWFSVMLGFCWQKSKEANSQIPSDWDVQIGNF